MARSILKAKGRREGQGGFSRLIHAYFETLEYAALSPRAVKALIDIYCQYRGSNNGDLTGAFSVMRKRGWSSKDQLSKALKELLDGGWLMVTRQGGRHSATLYAVTFMPIDACGGKLDVKATATAPHLWKKTDDGACEINFPSPPHGAMCPATRVNDCALNCKLPRTAGQSCRFSAMN